MPGLQPARGTQDLLPEAARRHRAVSETARACAELYGFAEIATPIFEFTEVFARPIGEHTDIVAKEMYTFTDRGGDEVTLRPENTAGVVRAVLSNGLTQAAPLKFFYSGPMFRYERPQKGRFRQFHQIGVELLGVPQPQADIEVIALGQRILDRLGIAGHVVLELNTLGDPESRAAYREALVRYFTGHLAQLSEDSRRRLERNTLRLLDSTEGPNQIVCADAPAFADYLNEASRAFFARVRDGLDRLGIAYRLNPRLVRGLDYYTHTAFEFVTADLGAQGTVMGGGRYDGLIETMGGPAMAGVGWAAGIERLAMLIDEPPAPPRPDRRPRRGADRRRRDRRRYGDPARSRQRRAAGGAARRPGGAARGAVMEPALESRLDQLVRRHGELRDALAAGSLAGADFARLSKEYSELSPIVDGIEALRRARAEMAAAAELADDPEMKALAEEEMQRLRERIPELELQVKLALLPKDEDDERNAILEVRAGTGGEEAALFAAELFRMYQRYAALRGWRFEVLDISETGIGGFKEAAASISGRDVFARLKFESGVHRVQRVPETEASGRIHTSAATVAVLPEAEEVDIRIDDKDLRIDVFRASGPGGQSVNTTDSAVRLTHLPTGLVVIQQDEKSQHKNKARALKVLRARLYEMERQAKDAARAADRKSQVGSGDRSERIRTYNFPQGRVTDHRINLTLYKIDKVMSGEALDEIIEAILAADRAARLAAAA